LPSNRQKKQRTCCECGKVDTVRSDYPNRTCLECSIRLRGPHNVPAMAPRTSAKSSSLEVGRAAEYLVCADLILQGYPAFPVAPGLPYDVIVEAAGALLRLQVKATLQPKAVPQRAVWVPSYLFGVRRCGRGGRRSYDESEIDGVALVALDAKMIAYMPLAGCRQTIHLRVPGATPAKNAKRKNSMADYPWADFLASREPTSAPVV